MPDATLTTALQPPGQVEPFAGFPPEALAFFTGLAADNTRSYWQAQRATFDTAVSQPMDALLAELAAYGPFHRFRMNRDVRFSPDKSPYKTMCGAAAQTPGGAVRGLYIAATGLLAAAGHYALAGDQLERYRAAVADEHTGTELEALLAELRADGLGITPGGPAPLRSAPRGYPKDHPRIGLLRGKGLLASRDIHPPRLHRADTAGDVRRVWEATTPLTTWLDLHVGPGPGRPGR